VLLIVSAARNPQRVLPLVLQGVVLFIPLALFTLPFILVAMVTNSRGGFARSLQKATGWAWRSTLKLFSELWDTACWIPRVLTNLVRTALANKAGERP